MNFSTPDQLDHLRDLYAGLAHACNFDVEEFATQNSINLHNYRKFKNLLAAHNYIQEGNGFMALYELHWVVEDEFERFGVKFATATQQQIKDLYTTLTNCLFIKDTYTRYVTEEYPALLRQYDNPALYGTTVLTAELVPPLLFALVEKSIKEKMFKGYVYRAGSEPLGDDLGEFSLPSKMVITKDISTVLGSATPLPTGTIVNLVMVLEDPLVYSYFVFVVRHRDHVWIYTDNLNHTNPHTKTSSRKPGRKVEGKFDTVALPYRFMDDMNHHEQGDKLSKTAQHFEGIKDIATDFDLDEKFFAQCLIGAFLDDIRRQPPITRLLTTTDYVRDMKLLGEVEVVPAEAHDFLDWNEHTQQRYRDIVEALGIGGTELVRVEPTHYLEQVKGWLATPEKFEEMARWVAFDQQRETIDNKLDEINKTNNRWDNTPQKAFQKLFVERVAHVVKNLTSYDHIWVESDNSRGRYDLMLPIKRQMAYPYAGYGSYCSKNIEGRKKERCMHCAIHKESFRFMVGLRDRDALVWLLGLEDRAELPLHMQSYSTRDYDLHNTITQNVHPLARVWEPFSHQYRNELNVVLDMCKPCWNKYRKANGVGETLQLDFRTNSQDGQSPVSEPFI